MKQVLFILIFFISALSFAQENTGTISGNLLDFESNNQPLIFAKVLIKETGTEVLSDEKGFFKFENLNDGEYTLVSSFTGYETKESKIKVESNQTTTFKITLEPSTISLEDLMMAVASVDKPQASAINN
ncbi:MAG: carboxypeptidase-like regulatory domain-containing protein [Algibacter sp.]|uniref:carboxypeptidase-like regulatory domain-containing protein n=1 Tax=Algibacter sp. TaxID=1872428 RepID=UPI00261A7230|nr:carboxypeptidase-like regulatory domain-containing protein [Algibacter sp.]MDG1730182.1 carboxypeptidase-like regulatory domain-containing protein [Algibacter sp.]MDG2179991.1 carboxypeptidase-like regulatory domain-containing protein [Algibacter sp.]